MINAFTVDLEDWYQGLTSTSTQVEKWHSHEDRVVESSDRLLTLLDNAGVKATFFVLGYLADQHPQLIRRIAETGHEIALHGYLHYRVNTLSPQEFKQDILKGKQAVERASGVTPVGYRAPMFSINKKSLWAFDILEEEGFHYDSSVFPTINMLYGYPSAPRKPYLPLNGKSLIEIPLSTVKLLGLNFPIAGGFYLRSLPYPLFSAGLRRVNQQGLSAVIYIHPWDLDENQPLPNPTPRERFTHYYNLKSTEEKIKKLLNDFKFAPLKDLIQRPDFVSKKWSSNGYS